MIFVISTYTVQLNSHPKIDVYILQKTPHLHVCYNGRHTTYLKTSSHSFINKSTPKFLNGWLVDDAV